MPTPGPRRPPTTAEAFFRLGFGCLSALATRIIIVVVVVLVMDWRSREKAARLEAGRAETSEIATRLIDELAKTVDADGRFIRRPDGALPETDAWGRPFRLSYRSGTISETLEVRSAGPDGEYQTRDDVVATHTSRVTNHAIARDATGGMLDAAKARLFGKGKPGEEKK